MLVSNNKEVMVSFNSFDLKESLQRFFNENELKEKSKDTYKKAFKQFFIYLATNKIESPNRNDILNYKEYLRESKSAYTVNAYLTAVRKLFSFLEAVELHKDITKGIKGLKIQRSFNKDSLTPEQAKELLSKLEKKASSKTATIADKRNFAISNLLLRTGLRTIEIYRANVDDIRQAGGRSVIYIQGKGRDYKDNFVLLTDKAIKPLYSYLKASGAKGKDPLFSGTKKGCVRLKTESISRIIKESLRSIGLDNSRLTAHSLRHSAITFSLMAGASLQEAKEMARHSNINTTLIYSHNINRLSDNAPELKINNII